MKVDKDISITLSPVKDEELPAFVSWSCPECGSSYTDVVDKYGDPPRISCCLDCGAIWQFGTNGSQ